MANDKQQPIGVTPKYIYEEVRAGDLVKALNQRINSNDMFNFNSAYSIQYLIDWAKELVWRLENLENMKDERF